MRGWHDRPGIAGVQSFVQRSGHGQNFNMEGVAFDRRLQLGRVAFYGAFEVPDDLKREYTIVNLADLIWLRSDDDEAHIAIVFIRRMRLHLGEFGLAKKDLGNFDARYRTRIDTGKHATSTLPCRPRCRCPAESVSLKPRTK